MSRGSGNGLRGRLGLLSPRLVRRKPLFLLRAAARMARERLGLPTGVRGAMFSTHYVCNFNCEHCYEKTFLKTRRTPLTLAEKIDAIGQCLDLGVLSFDFVGGESHLDPDFETLVRAARPHRTYITLATNGWGFDEAKVRRCLDLGIDKLNISLDSWDPAEHDAFRRKPGAHAAALNTLDLCRRLGMGTTVSVVVYRDYTKSPNFRKLVDFALETGTRLAFKLAVPVGSWEGNEECLVTEDDVRAMNELHAAHPQLTRDIHGNAEGCCPAFRDFFTVTAFGDVLPCNAIHISFGNLRETPLADILRRARRVREFREPYPGCLPAESREFIETRLKKTFGADAYPVRAEDVFDDYRPDTDRSFQ